jgi:hypothetical protein
MQNEPKFRKSQMIVNKVLTMNYEKKDTWWTGKKRTQTNPNEPKTNPIPSEAKMSVTFFVTKNYENDPALRPRQNKPKQTQLTKRQRMNTTVYFTNNYANQPLLRAPENKRTQTRAVVRPNAPLRAVTQKSDCLRQHRANSPGGILTRQRVKLENSLYHQDAGAPASSMHRFSISLVYWRTYTQKQPETTLPAIRILPILTKVFSLSLPMVYCRSCILPILTDRSNGI